jgi:hypothetical protein
MLMDGTDFFVHEIGARRAGRKAMAANLSDIAAMAGSPLAAVTAVALPHGGGLGFAEELYRGLRDAADEFGMPIVGGDTNSWTGPLVISVTVLGEPTGRGAVTRAGALSRVYNNRDFKSLSKAIRTMRRQLVPVLGPEASEEEPAQAATVSPAYPAGIPRTFSLADTAGRAISPP